MSAHASDDGPDLHEIFGMETGEHPVVLALPERETVAVEAEVVREELGGAGGGSATSPEHAGGGPPNEPEVRIGITTPTRRGSSSRFLTDVIVDMGLVARERVDDAIETLAQLGDHARAGAGRRAATSAPTASHARWPSATASTTSTSASSRSTWAPPTSSPRRPPSATRRCRWRSSTSARCWWRWPTRPTCSRSTTSRS